MTRRGRCLTSCAAVLVGFTSAVAWGAVVGDTGTITTVAGSGAGGGGGTDGEPATMVPVDHPRGLAVLAGGGFAIAEPFTHMVFRVSGGGRIFRVAGTGVAGYSGDGGPAVDAQLAGVHGVAVAPGGGLVLADTGNDRIRKVWPDGTITTVAGNGVEGFSGDGGPAIAAELGAPRGVAALPDGGLLIPDTENHRVRRVWPDGRITTVAGTGVRGYSGDGGAAVDAELDLPFAVAAQTDGGFLIADTGNDRVRRVRPDGTISTAAGNGTHGFSGDGGPASAAALAAPHGVAALADGGFLVTDTFNNRVRRIWANQTISTVAGTGAPAFSGDDGPATHAALNQPKPLAVLVDASGFLIGDAANNRVRLVEVDLRPTLELRVPDRHIASRTGRRATLRYSVSEPATARLSVLRGRTLVLGVRSRASVGTNTLRFGRSLRPGTYGLRLVAETNDGRTAQSTGSLKVVR